MYQCTNGQAEQNDAASVYTLRVHWYTIMSILFCLGTRVRTVDAAIVCGYTGTPCGGG